jgi:hypothetical protein
LLSTPYFIEHKGLIAQELLALVGITLLGAVIVAAAWKTNFIKWLDTKTKPWRGWALAAFVIIFTVFLVSRPLWYQAPNNNGSISGYLSAIQIAEGNQPEARSYRELTTYWVSWYIGSVAAVVGVVGVAFFAYRAFNRRNLPMAAFALAFASTALLYFIYPSIAADQIWAARRMLPVIVPSLLIFAVILLDHIDRRFMLSRLAKPVFFGFVSLMLLITPLAVSAPFASGRDTNQLPLFTGLCKSLPKNAAVLWLGEGQHYNVQATRSFCNVPTSAYTPPTVSREDLAEAAKNAKANGYQPVVAVFAGDKYLLGEDAINLVKASEHSYKEMTPSITKPPSKIETKSYQFFMGILANDGQVVR